MKMPKKVTKYRNEVLVLARQWPSKAIDERTCDQDSVEKPAAQDESSAGIEAVAMIYFISKYDGADNYRAEDSDVDGSYVS